MEFVIKRERRRQRAGLEPYCTGIWFDEWYTFGWYTCAKRKSI